MPRRIHPFEHLRKYAVYRRALLSYLALSALTVLVVSAVLFVAFGRQSTRDITESGEAILEQTAGAIDLLKEQVRTVGNALIEDSTVVASLRSREIDRLLEYRTNLVFTTFRAVYPFIRFVGLYNNTTDRYVSTEGLTADVERALITKVFQSDDLEFFTSHVRPIDYTYPRTSDSGVVLSFVLRPDARLQRPNESFLLVNIELEYLKTLVKNMSSGYQGHIVVTTEDGQTVVGGESALTEVPAFMHQLRREQPDGLETGSYRVHFDGRNHIVTTTVSTGLGWRVYGIRSRSEIISHSFALLWLTLGVGAVIVLVGSVVSLAFTNRIYDPLSQLVDQIELADIGGTADTAENERINEYEILGQAYRRFAARVGLLEGALHEDLSLVRRTYLHSLLVGMRVELPESREMAEQVVESTRADAYAVVLCRVDRFRDLQKTRSAVNLSNSFLLISRAYHEGLADLGFSTPVLIEGEELAIIIGGTSEALIDEVVDRVRETQVRLVQSVGFTTSVAISPPVPSREALHEAFVTARSALRDRFFTGPSSVLVSSSAPARSELFTPFPSRLSRKLIEGLRLAREDEVNEILPEFQRTVRQNSYHGALALYHQMSVELFSEFEDLARLAPDAFSQHRTFVENLFEVEFAADADRAIRVLCDTILETEASVAADTSRVLHRQAVDHIEANLIDPNLSLDMVADSLRVSSGHLGRVFAERADKYISDYINEVRVNRARNLLLTTNMNVSEVAESVGITNTTYFFTLFRKYAGTTPARFRRSTKEKA